MSHKDHHENLVVFRQTFDILKYEFAHFGESRASLQIFNELIEKSWKSTTDRYKDIRDSLRYDSASVARKTSVVKHSVRFSGENPCIIDMIDNGCYWRDTKGMRRPMVDVSKF